MPATFNDFETALQAALLKYATTSWATYRNQAQSDGQAFVNQARQDLQMWTQQLAARTISPAAFRFNVSGEAALAALKQSGLAKVALDQFTNGLVDVIVNTATSTFLGGA